MTDDSRESFPDSLQFYNQVNRRTMVVITGVIVSFGLLLLLAGLHRALKSFQADDLVLLVLGTLVTVFGYLLWRFAMKPRFEIRHDSVRISNFFGYRTIRFHDVRGVGVFDRKVRGKVYGASGEVSRMTMPITIEMIAFRMIGGKLRLFALPAFSGNQRCLDAIKHHSGLEVEPLRDDPEALAEWRA